MLRALLATSGARPTDRARWAADMGDLDAAFRELERAVAEKDIRLPFVTEWKDYAPLWKDPRFAAFKARIGLGVAAPPTTP